MQTKEEILTTAREGLKPTFPEWLDDGIQAKVDRFISLPRGITNYSFGIGMDSLEGQFPFLVKSAYSSIQQDLSSPKETPSIIHAIENLEYRLTILELSRGINNQGWKTFDYEQDGIIVVAHPNFRNAREFSNKLIEATKKSRRKIVETKIQDSFGITSAAKSEKEILFLIEDQNVWEILGIQQLKERMGLWWVRELGDGIGLYYSKGRKNLDNPTILASNRSHEFTHACQKKALTNATYDQLFSEFSLLEGIATWWEPLLIREQYSEKDFLSYHLLTDRFMTMFLTSRSLLSREGHDSTRFPWNAILTGMIFQRIGMLAEAKETSGTTSPLETSFDEFNFDQVKKGLRIVSNRLTLANKIVADGKSLSEQFFELLCQNEFGIPFNYQKLLEIYDEKGYNYAKKLLSGQALTQEEIISLEEQERSLRARNG